MRTRCGVGTLLVMLLVLPQGLASCIPASLSQDSGSRHTVPRAVGVTGTPYSGSPSTTTAGPGSESPAPPEPGQSYEDAVRRGLVNEEYAVQVAGSSVRNNPADDRAALQFTVTNAGKRDDEYRLEVLPTGVLLLAEPAETIALAAGTSTTVSVAVRLVTGASDPSVLFRASSTRSPSVVDEATVTPF